MARRRSIERFRGARTVEIVGSAMRGARADQFEWKRISAQTVAGLVASSFCSIFDLKSSAETLASCSSCPIFDLSSSASALDLRSSASIRPPIPPRFGIQT